MIRATRHGTMSSLASNLGVNGARLRTAEEQAVTGRKYNRASDSPIVVSEIHQVSSAAADQQTWQLNAGTAGTLHSAMDTALGQAHDLLVRLRELAVQMASETQNASGRSVAAVEVSGLADSMLDVANAQMDGRYVFAGTAYDGAAFDATFAYQGTPDEPTTQVGADRFVRSGLDGSQVFQGGVDIFATITSLQTALATNNAAGVSATLSDLDAATRQISDWRGTVGSDQVAAEDASAVAESLDVLFNERLSGLVNVDPVEAYTALGDAQNAYNSTLQVLASSRTNSLLDMLG